MQRRRDAPPGRRGAARRACPAGRGRSVGRCPRFRGKPDSPRAHLAWRRWRRPRLRAMYRDDGGAGPTPGPATVDRGWPPRSAEEHRRGAPAARSCTARARTDLADGLRVEQSRERPGRRLRSRTLEDPQEPAAAGEVGSTAGLRRASGAQAGTHVRARSVKPRPRRATARPCCMVRARIRREPDPVGLRPPNSSPRTRRGASIMSLSRRRFIEISASACLAASALPACASRSGSKSDSSSATAVGAPIGFDALLE